LRGFSWLLLALARGCARAEHQLPALPSRESPRLFKELLDRAHGVTVPLFRLCFYLPREGPESFPSWTSPVRPRSPALVKELRSRGLPSRSVRRPFREPASEAGDPKIRRA